MPFKSYELREFSNKWGFRITTPSPHYHQSNGLSERMIQTVKQLLKKCEDSGDDPYIAMMNLRDSPINGTNVTPAEMLMGRKIRTKLPSITPRLSKNQFFQ